MSWDCLENKLANQRGTHIPEAKEENQGRGKRKNS